MQYPLSRAYLTILGSHFPENKKLLKAELTRQLVTSYRAIQFESKERKQADMLTDCQEEESD